ncbi:uncharacterized protein EI90DRAFT_2101331 [Cantharellus anzutake]|uniref:uncharacterized protein n=1 Tax=Cantharellus anzutake TaxID=1750568 RepID=UPI00190331CC|nr:uncharacterized protein EI90DRAFT_2101331 [Cantharellus anzutake]KAF8340703.1 hypothetical protein EI90DRAFT_2101331 [Cantharellus anzutake]
MAEVTFGRIYRGSGAQTLQSPSEIPSISSLDSAFQIQEYISLLIRHDAHDVKKIITIPSTSGASNVCVDPLERGIDEDTTDASVGVSEQPVEGKVSGGDSAEDALSGDEDRAADEQCWIYEQLRRVAQDLSHPLVSTLQQECNRSTCPEMKADEWMYLCVAHSGGTPVEQCCAIDYIVHTLDSATALLNSPRAFPSRISIPNPSRKHFLSLARRLSRIFAHAYFHHREAFEQCEAETSLCSRFHELCRKFDLVPVEFLVPPKSAHLPSPNPPTSITKEIDTDFDRNIVVTYHSSSSHSMSSDDRLQSPSNSGDMGGRLTRTDTMFLSSESLEQTLNADRNTWGSDTLNIPLQLPNTEDEFGEEDEDEDGDEGDEDGYDIIEGVHRGQLNQIDEGPEDVVVDEMDGIGANLPLIDTTRGITTEDHAKSTSTMESASALPLLTSTSPPTTSHSPGSSFSHGSPTVSVTLPHSSPSSAARRSPRRKDTVRQIDVSPILTTRPELAPEEDESEPLTLPGGIPVYPRVADTPSMVALPLSTNSHQAKPSPVGQVEEEDEEESVEEVDLAGPYSNDD